MEGNSAENSTPEVIVLDDELDSSESGITSNKMQCIFTWCIKNYNSCQLENGEGLCSPIFSADSESRWYMSMFPNGQTNNEEHISVHVIPLSTIECDRGKLLCEISILDQASKKWHSEKIVKEMSSLERFEFATFVTKMELSAEKDRALPGDMMTICCQMCAFEDTQLLDPTPSRAYSEPTQSDTQLRRFSSDFKFLYNSGKFSDVTLVLKDGTIPAHRVILMARSSEFAQRLMSQTENKINIPDLDKKTTDALLSYIYTGEVNSSSTVLPLDLYQAAKTYNMYELERSITPNRIFAQTEVIKEKYSYTWRLRNFMGINRNQGRIIYSDKFHTGATELWSLSLDFRSREGDDTEDDIGIYLNKLWRANEKKAVFVQFQIYVQDKNSLAHRFKIEMEKCYKQTSRFGTSTFLKKSYLLRDRNDLLPGDTLTICCNMNVSDSASLSKIQHSYSSTNTNLSEISHIRSLSDCFRDLFFSNANTDVSVKCTSKKKFSLHKAILCARSPKFINFFETQDVNLDHFTIDISGIRQQILELLFLLIYTGEVEGLSCETAQDLFAAATYYEIAEANNIFSHFLRSNLSIENALQMMALSMTMDKQDLKSSVLEFICSHAEELINGSQWPDFIRDNSNCSTEILRCLSEGYRKSKRRRHE